MQIGTKITRNKGAGVKMQTESHGTQGLAILHGEEGEGEKTGVGNNTVVKMRIGKRIAGTKTAKKDTTGRKIAGNKQTGNNLAPGKRTAIHKTVGQKAEVVIKGVADLETLSREVGAEEEEIEAIGGVEDGEVEVAVALAMKAEAGLMKIYPATRNHPARPRPA